jgi:hypothetical protein
MSSTLSIFGVGLYDSAVSSQSFVVMTTEG